MDLNKIFKYIIILILFSTVLFKVTKETDVDPRMNSFRIILFPLKLPRTSAANATTTANSPLLPNNTPLPLSFLFVHLSKSLTRESNPSVGLKRRSALNRFLNWGEAKWQEYGEAPPRSIKGIMHRLGSSLLDKIPVTEKQLWRLHALHQHFQTDQSRRYFEVETGSSALADEQNVRTELHKQLNALAAVHRRWSIFSSALILPVAILSILPFGKLVLAWIIFRAVAHYRAYQGAHFLARCLTGQDSQLVVRFKLNSAIDRFLPLPPTHTSTSRAFNDPFTGLARDLELAELALVLPKALEYVCKREAEQLTKDSGLGRRRFSNQNLLDP